MKHKVKKCSVIWCPGRTNKKGGNDNYCKRHACQADEGRNQCQNQSRPWKVCCSDHKNLEDRALFIKITSYVFKDYYRGKRCKVRFCFTLSGENSGNGDYCSKHSCHMKYGSNHKCNQKRMNSWTQYCQYHQKSS